MSISGKRNSSILVLLALALAFSISFVVSCSLGRYPIKAGTVLRVLFSRVVPIERTWEPQIETVLFRVRLPRVLAAALVGAALSAAGAAYQGLFQNPLVSPDVLGVSAGAGFGAALGISLSLGALGTMLGSFGFGVGAALVVGLFARRLKGERTLALVLCGIVVGSLFSSATSFLKLVADPNNVLPAITYWLMGSLAAVRESDVLFAAPLIVASLLLLFLLRWRINFLAMGDDEAKALGANVTLSRRLVIMSATLATAASVSVSGMVGWIGLVIPHLARRLVGSDYRRLMPASMLLGATFLLAVDDFARLLATTEIPLGILTSFIGAPFFLYLMRRQKARL